jgi:hypothetical protein
MRRASERSSQETQPPNSFVGEEGGKIDRRIRPAKLWREAKDRRLISRLAINSATRGRLRKPPTFAERAAPAAVFADGPKINSAKGVGCIPGWMFG